MAPTSRLVILSLALLTWIGCPGPSGAVSRPLRMIEPLVAGDYGTVCTTFAISATGRWLTALHCHVTSDDGAFVPLTIAGMPTTVLWTFPEEDLLVLATPLGLTPLRLALVGPQIGDAVHSFGYALGQDEGLAVTGTVAQVSISGLRRLPQLMVSMPTCQGMSGSPILDAHDGVLSVFQALPTAPCAAFGLGLTYDRLVETTRTLWDLASLAAPASTPAPSTP